MSEVTRYDGRRPEPPYPTEQDYAALAAERDALARQVEAVEAWCNADPHDRRVEFSFHEGPARCWQTTSGINRGPVRWPVVSAPSLPALGQRLIEGGHVA